MLYRREIDGLRALAVIPVMLFHAGIAGFGGGFVGVDVFFVISGYLITTIIISELKTGSFSIARFYERRARRILPALFFVIACSIPFAWFWLLPNDMKDFSQSVLAVTLFSSNILFWTESGYFDTAAELKPLLHTWSLAAEEQFYVLFPLFLLLAWRIGTRKVVLLILVTTATSLAIAQWGSRAEPAATFFLLPARAWELAIGSLVAFYFAYSPTGPRNLTRDNLLATLGVLLIAFSIYVFDDATPFPSLFALAPTAGTALIILYAWPGTVVGSVLGSKVFVGIGLISYSAYLWHQPVLAFARHRSTSEPSTLLLAGLCLLSLALAYASWRFVETPFRHKTVVNRRALVGFAVAGSLALAAFGALGHLSNGFLALRFPNLSDAQRSFLTESSDAKALDDGDCRFHNGRIDPQTIARLDQCFQKLGPATIVLGDSHAIDMYQAIARDPQNAFVYGLSRGFCRPQTQDSDCHYEAFLDFARSQPEKIARVLYTQSGAYLIADEEGQPGSKKQFRKAEIPVYSPHSSSIIATADYLAELSKAVDVTWIGPRIEPHINTARLVRQSVFCRTEKIEVPPAITATFEALDQAIKHRVATDYPFAYLSQIDAVKFSAEDDLFDCSNVYWSDGDHWSSAGEARFGPRIVASLLRQDGGS